MKSTSGAHFVALDHVRALAALLVFVWHFTHGTSGYPSPFEGAPIWGPLVLFDEGHVGVSVFMTLSGYLFAKLLDGKKVKYGPFLWNRALRLFPLLIVVMIIRAAAIVVGGGNMTQALGFVETLPRGLVLPTWPNGGWSITVELHFYLVLPLLLLLKRQSSLFLLLVLLVSLSCRTYIHSATGEVQSLAYWTIIGRIDQFTLGILGYTLSHLVKGRHVLIAVISVAFISIYYWFDVNGGFYLTGGYPSKSSLWIWMPTAEGAAFAALIAWYDTSFSHRTDGASRVVSKIGEYSFSIYLLHFFVVFKLASWLQVHVIDMSSFYVAVPMAILCFGLMIPLGYLSMKLVEAPFLRMRRSYYASNLVSPLS